MRKLSIGGITLVASLLMVACEASPRPEPAVPPASANVDGSSAPASGEIAQYPTRVGTISLAVPNDYVRLSEVDQPYYRVFAALHPKLESVEVFISKSDWERSKSSSQPLRDQLFQLQLFQGKLPPIDDATWRQLRIDVPAFMSGKAASDVVNAAEAPSKSRFNVISQGKPTATSLEVGKVVVFHVSDQDVRWMAKGDVGLQEAGTSTQYTALIASAMVRRGTSVFLLQSVTAVKDAQDEADARRNLDAWVSSIR